MDRLTDVEKVIDFFHLFLVNGPKVFVFVDSFFVGKDMFLDEGTKVIVTVMPIYE